VPALFCTENNFILYTSVPTLSQFWYWKFYFYVVHSKYAALADRKRNLFYRHFLYVCEIGLLLVM